MSGIEIAFLAILGFGFYKGYGKGLVNQLASFIGLILGYFIASYFSGQLHQYLIEKDYLSENTTQWISYGLCFIGIILIVRFLSSIIEKGLKLIGINFINKIGGGIFGVLKYVLLLSIALFFLEEVSLLKSLFGKAITESELYLFFVGIGKGLIGSFY